CPARIGNPAARTPQRVGNVSAGDFSRARPDAPLFRASWNAQVDCALASAPRPRLSGALHTVTSVYGILVVDQHGTASTPRKLHRAGTQCRPFRHITCGIALARRGS